MLALHVRVLLFDVRVLIQTFFIINCIWSCKYNNNRELKQVVFLTCGHKLEVNIIFACQDCGLSQIFKLIISTSEKIADSINVVVRRQVK